MPAGPGDPKLPFPTSLGVSRLPLGAQPFWEAPGRIWGAPLQGWSADRAPGAARDRHSLLEHPRPEEPRWFPHTLGPDKEPAPFPPKSTNVPFIPTSSCTFVLPPSPGCSGWASPGTQQDMDFHSLSSREHEAFQTLPCPCCSLRGLPDPFLPQGGLKIPFGFQGSSLGARLREFSSISAGNVGPRILSPVPHRTGLSQGWIMHPGVSPWPLEAIPVCSSLECSGFVLTSAGQFISRWEKRSSGIAQNVQKTTGSRAALELPLRSSQHKKIKNKRRKG